MAVTVYILTTEGPVRIQRIAREQTGVQSVVCLDGRAHALPVSSRYDAFVRNPTGVIERATGHGAYRIDVDQPIDDGDSWQLGVYIAHLTEGAAPGKDVHVFATGEVDRDLNVRPVGHLKQKIAAALPLMSELKDAELDVQIFVPKTDENHGAYSTDGIAVTGVLHVDAAFATLGAPHPIKPPQPEPESEKPYAVSNKVPNLVKLGGLVFCMLVGWFVWAPVSWIAMADDGELHALEGKISETGTSFFGRYQQDLFVRVQSLRRADGPPPQLSGSVSIANTVNACSSDQTPEEVDWKGPVPGNSVICDLKISADLVEPGHVLVGRMAYWPRGLGEGGKPERTMRGSARLDGRTWTLKFERHPDTTSTVRVVMIWGAADPVGPQPWFATLLSEQMDSAAFVNAEKRLERLGYVIHAVDWQRPGD